jgi:hypothetical protein
MLWNGNALMLFAHFHTTNSILSIATDLRLLSRHVVGVPMEKRPTLTMRDRASELPHSNEWWIILRVVRLAGQLPEGSKLQISKSVFQLNSNDLA